MLNFYQQLPDKLVGENIIVFELEKLMLPWLTFIDDEIIPQMGLAYKNQ
jgi:hypothetical protein